MIFLLKKPFNSLYFAIFAIKPRIYVKLCLKTAISLLLGKTKQKKTKRGENISEILPLITNRGYS